jgi:hypothetical protein
MARRVQVEWNGAAGGVGAVTMEAAALVDTFRHPSHLRNLVAVPTFRTILT